MCITRTTFQFRAIWLHFQIRIGIAKIAAKAESKKEAIAIAYQLATIFVGH